MIDSHAHIDMAAFDDDRDDVLARARQAGITAIINIAGDLASGRKSLELARSYPEIFTAVGVHPNDVSAVADGDLGWVVRMASEDRVVAIGEIGLDFYRRRSPRECQLEFFRRQLELAAERDMPVVIHCRDAHRDVLPTLDSWVKSVSRDGEYGVMHCFSGDLALARRYIELGFLISLAGPVTYPSAADRVEVARELPLEKLMVETDSPFLAPQLHRGRRNEPSYVALVIEHIARIRGMPADAVARATAQNAVRLFRLPHNSNN